MFFYLFYSTCALVSSLGFTLLVFFKDLILPLFASVKFREQREGISVSYLNWFML
jgi:hypothetical protein